MEGETKPIIETKVEEIKDDDYPLDSPAVVYEDSDPKLQEEEKVLLKELKHHHHHTTTKNYTDSELGATFNLVNATVGSGILGLPFVLRETGLILGVGFLFIGATISMISLSMLRIAHKMMLEREPGAKDYEDMGYHLYGSFMAFLVKVAVILINFGGVRNFNLTFLDYKLYYYSRSNIFRSVENGTWKRSHFIYKHLGVFSINCSSSYIFEYVKKDV